MDWDQGSKPASEVTLGEIESLCQKIAELREIKDKFEDELKSVNAKIEMANSKLIDVLGELGKTNYESAVGKFIVQNRFQVAMPKEPEHKKAFLEYLESKGLSDMLTVHSRTLNAFYKTEIENAQAQGDPIPTIPGLGLPTHVQTISFKRSK